MSTSSDGIDWPSAASDSEETGPPLPPVPPSSAAGSSASSVSGAASSLSLQMKRRPGSRSSGSGTDMASDDTSVEDVEWKEKYLALEAQLEKFRIQAAKIRVVLGERVCIITLSSVTVTIIVLCYRLFITACSCSICAIVSWYAVYQG